MVTLNAMNVEETVFYTWRTAVISTCIHLVNARFKWLNRSFLIFRIVLYMTYFRGPLFFSYINNKRVLQELCVYHIGWEYALLVDVKLLSMSVFDSHQYTMLLSSPSGGLGDVTMCILLGILH